MFTTSEGMLLSKKATCNKLSEFGMQNLAEFTASLPSYWVNAVTNLLLEVGLWAASVWLILAFTSSSKSRQEKTKTGLDRAQPEIMCMLQLLPDDHLVRRNSVDAGWEHWKSVPRLHGFGWHHQSIISSMCWGHKVKGTGSESVASIVPLPRMSVLLVREGSLYQVDTLFNCLLTQVASQPIT